MLGRCLGCGTPLEYIPGRVIPPCKCKVWPRTLDMGNDARLYVHGGGFPEAVVPVVKALKQRREFRTANEDALYEALEEAGFAEVTRGAHDPIEVFVRGYAWGLHLMPRRKFQADAAFPAAHLLVEVEGGAHSVQKMRAHDIRRRQLAEAAGWRVLSVLPEQIGNGEAVTLVTQHIDSIRLGGVPGRG